MPFFKYANGVETFYLNFSDGFGALSDIWDGVFKKIVHGYRN